MLDRFTMYFLGSLVGLLIINYTVTIWSWIKFGMKGFGVAFVGLIVLNVTVMYLLRKSSVYATTGSFRDFLGDLVVIIALMLVIAFIGAAVCFVVVYRLTGKINPLLAFTGPIIVYCSMYVLVKITPSQS